MKSKKYISFFLTVILLAGVSLLFSCKKTPSPPPVQAVATGPTVTIQQLRNMYGTDNGGTGGLNIHFTSNTILNVVVTCDESSGNLYKQVYVRDNSGEFAITNHYGAISLRFLHGTAGFLTTGDSIAVNLNGSTLTKSTGGSLEIDSIDGINQV